MIRFALVVASVLGFVLTAALGNMTAMPRTARCLPWVGCA